MSSYDWSLRRWVTELTGEGRCAQFKPHVEIFTKYRPAYMSAVVGVAQFEGQFVEGA